MLRRLSSQLACVVAIGLSAGFVFAEDSSVTFRDDFANGWSSEWRVPEGADLSTQQFQGRGILTMGRNKQGEPLRLSVVSAPHDWQDFVLDVEMRRESGKWVGVVLRGKYDLILDATNRLVLRKEYQIVQTS
jgi:hypothetical protein